MGILVYYNEQERLRIEEYKKNFEYRIMYNFIYVLKKEAKPNCKDKENIINNDA